VAPRVDVGVLLTLAFSSPGAGTPVGGLWLLRGLGANDVLTYNTTTARYLALTLPLLTSGDANAADATFRAPKPFTLHTLAILFETAFPALASASFRLNIDGTTSEELQLDLVAGESKKVVTGGGLPIAQDAMVCLECTADAGGTPDIKSIAIAYRTRSGANPDQ
jgi:hypothetical protein